MTEWFKQDLATLVAGAATSIAQSGLRIVLVLVAGHVAVRFLHLALGRLEEVLVRERGSSSSPVPPASA